MRQISLLKRSPVDHGGANSEGKRKTPRPFSPKAAMHLTLKASRARGSWSMAHSRNKGFVHVTIQKASERHRVRVYRFSNVGNHIHLLIRARTHQGFKNFLREISGIIASGIMGAVRGRAVGKFWDHLAHSRIISPGPDFRATQAYLIKNLLESFGLDRRELDEVFKGAKNFYFEPAPE